MKYLILKKPQRALAIMAFTLLVSAQLSAQIVTLGTDAGKSAHNKESSTSTYLGFEAGMMNMVGSYNLFAGFRAGAYSRGGYNIMLGPMAGYASSTGANSVFIGSFAGIRSGGRNNTLIGYLAGSQLVTGSDNVFLGSNSGLTNNGERNVFIGNNADYYDKTLSDRLFIDNTKNATPLIDGNFATDHLRINGSFEATVGATIYGTLNIKNSQNKQIFHVTADEEKVFIGKSAWDKYNTHKNDPNTALIAEEEYSLWVSKGIVTEDIALTSLHKWADYVFNDGYNLAKLENVEQFIKKNGHLPNIPSQKEVFTKGYKLQEINAKFLEKIEELTLYTIEQNKALKKQEALNKTIAAQLQILMEKIEGLEAKNNR